MRYCDKPFKNIYVANSNGECYFCQWMIRGDACLGSLLQADLAQIYHSEKAIDIRQTIQNQSFAYCSAQYCPYLSKNSLPEIDETHIKAIISEAALPTQFELGYDWICNQRCEICRDTEFIPPNGYRDRLHMFKEKLLPAVNAGEGLVTSLHGDPFFSGDMLELLHELHPQNSDFKLVIETNGVYCDADHWKEIEHLCNAVEIVVVLSFNSLSEEVYPYVSCNGNFDKLIENLSFIKKLRSINAINELIAKVVVQDRNFRELPNFVNKCFEQYGFDKVLLKPVFQRNILKADAFWFKDVLNPNHPYYEECKAILNDVRIKFKNVLVDGMDYAGHPQLDAPKQILLELSEKAAIQKKCVCTVLLISYNHVQYIKKAIESVLEQKTRYGYKIYIFDDASSDGTCEIIEDYAKKYPDIISAFISKENKGAQANFWRAVKSVDTPFCAILECDDYWCCDTKLEQQLEALYLNPECSFCAHNTRNLNAGDTYRKFEDSSIMVTLPKLCWDRVVTAHDLEMQYQGYINHINSRVIRMSSVDLESLQEKESFLYDNAQFFYLLAQGPMYYINQVMSVYVQTGKGSFSGERANKKLRIHVNNLMQVNRETNFVVEKIIFEHLSSFMGYWIWLLDVAEGKRTVGEAQNQNPAQITKRQKVKEIIKYLLPQFVIDFYKLCKRKLRGEK